MENPQVMHTTSRLPTAPSVCALGWVKCREHISLLLILCIIVYVTNKAHLSLIVYYLLLFIKSSWKSIAVVQSRNDKGLDKKLCSVLLCKEGSDLSDVVQC